MTARKAVRPWPGPATAPFLNVSLMEWVSADAARDQLTAGPGEYAYDRPSEWRPNVPFRAALTLSGVERGRSAARFVWVDTEDLAKYPMFMIDACRLMMRDDGVKAGFRDGWWIVMKRGQNYGVAAIDAHIAEAGVPACPVDGQGCSTCRVGGGNGTGGACARQGEISEEAP